MKKNDNKIFNKALKKISKFFSKDTVTNDEIQKKESYLVEYNNDLEWQEGDRVELTLRYLNTTNPISIDWTGDNKIADNNSRYISVQLGYRVVMFTSTDFLPPGSATITYHSILPGNLGKPIIPAGSHFAEKSWDRVNGILVLENVYRLDPGSTGFINLLYDLKARDLISNEAGILSDNNIKAEVKVTVDGQRGYTGTAGPISLKIELVKDEFKITKSAEQSIGTVDNDPDKNNADNFYWVDYTVDTSAIYHSRELEKGQIIDILPKDAVLVSVTDFYTRDVLYNSYSVPPELVPYVSYEPDLTEATGGKITYSFDRNDSKLINLNNNLFKFIVKVKFPLTVTEKEKVNYAEIKGFFEGEQEIYQTLDTASVSFTLKEPGFANWDGNDIYSVIKYAASESPHVVNANALQYGDFITRHYDDYAYSISKSKTTQPVDMVIIDDLMYYHNNNGFVHMEDTEYSFYRIRLIQPIYGVNTDYEVYVRYAERAANDFVLYKEGTISSLTGVTINFYNDMPPVVAFKVIYKGIVGTFYTSLVLYARVKINQTDAYLKQPRLVDNNSKIINYGFLDVLRNGESILELSSSKYRQFMERNNFTEEEINLLSNFDIATYGHYALRVKAQMLVELECYRPYIYKYAGTVNYDSNEGLYLAYWNVYAESGWGDLIKNYTLVDILPEGFSLKNVQRISLDSRYPIDYVVTVDENYKNSGRQRVMIKVTSPGGEIDQIINYLAFRINAYINDVNQFEPGSRITNYIALVAKDIPYPTDIRVGNNVSLAYRDDGSYFDRIDPSLVELWYDADSDRGADDYAWYSYNFLTIPVSPIAGRSGIEKYVKTDVNPYYSRVGSRANLGSKFEYNLTINNPQSNIKDIIVYDTFPFIGDRFHETSGGQIVPRGSQWSPTFNDIAIEAPNGINYTIYCTTNQEPGELGIDASWMEISEFFASGKLPADVKSIAVDFRGYTLLQRDSIKIYVTMNAPTEIELQGKIAVNTFYYTFNEEDGTAKSGESNKVDVTIFKPIATIGNTLFFDKNNNSIFEPEIGEVGIGGATVELYIEVNEEGSDTIIYNGYILKRVTTTRTSSAGTYSFTTDVDGVYFVKFINPNPNIYGLFSKKMRNYNENIQISQVDQNGFTDLIIINFEANDNKDINYPFADAGLIPALGEYNFKKVSDVPEGEYVELGGNTTFSIYDVENKSSDFELENFVLEDIPHKALEFRSIAIPAYENADNVKYTIKYKLFSSDDIMVVPFGENLSASTANKIDFLVSVQPSDHVDRIYVEFGNVPAGFRTIGGVPIAVEFTLSEDINMFDDVPGDQTRKTADNIAHLTFILNDTKRTYEDDDNITVHVPMPEKEFRKESDVPKGEYVIAGHKTTFSIYEVENKSQQYALENFTLEDVPHRGLRFKSITIPAYENANDVRYTIKYKLASSDLIQVIPGGENLSATESHKVDFNVPIRWLFDHVDRIYVEFGTVPAGFKPVNGVPIVIEFILSRYIDDFDHLPGSSDLMADNTAYLKYIVNGKEVELEDNDYVLVKERCGKPCKRKPCNKKLCERYQ